MEHSKDKYIDSIYVELGDYKDKLRTIYYKKKWNKKIIVKFKKIFYGREHRMLLNKCAIDINKIRKINDVKLSIKKISEYLSKASVFGDNYDHYIFFYLGVVIPERIKEIENDISLLESNICLVVGNAGSGKTNLLQNFSNTLVLNNKKNKLCYVNAKDVFGDFEKHLNDEYHFMKKDSSRRFRNFVDSLFYICFRRRTFVIIDGLNEQTNKEFYTSLCNYINNIFNKKRVILIMSTRTEYFDDRAKKIFKEYLDRECIVNEVFINNIKSQKGNNQFFEKYKNYFNFTGHINNLEKRKLISNPILARLFFETHKNKAGDVNIIDKNIIYDKYINMIVDELRITKKSINLIVEYMINNGIYSNIELDKLFDDKDVIEELIGSDLFISDKKTLNEGCPNVTTINTLSFKYDEMRDYLISNKLIEIYNNNSRSLINYLQNIHDNKIVITEGVFRNLYTYYKDIDFNICLAILSFDKNYWERNNEYFNSNVNMIFESGRELNSNEINYLDGIKINSHDLLKIILNCGYNDIYNCFPSNNYILKKIEDCLKARKDLYGFKNIDKEEYAKVVNLLVEENNGIENNYITRLNKLKEVLWRKDTSI